MICRKTLTSVLALSFGLMVSSGAKAADVDVSDWQGLNDQLRAGNNAIIQNDMTQWVWGTIGLDTTKSWAGVDGRGKILTANSSNNNTAIQWYDGNPDGGHVTLYVKNVIFDGFSKANSGGEISGGVFNIHSNSVENNFTFENATIKNSSSTATGSDSAQGGAIRNYVMYGQNLYITNAVFEDNKAIADVASNASGGALYLAFSQYVDNNVTNNSYKIENTTFRGNQAGLGGAVFIVSETNDASRSAPIDFSDVTFENNTAQNDGGAIYSRWGNIGNITGSFTGNTANFGGAIYNNDKSKINNISALFTNNKAENNDGGAIYNRNDSTITTISANFVGNTAKNNGGAIYNESGSTIDNITNSVFENNSSGTYDGGAIYDRTNAKINTITGTTFKNNTAKNGGGAISAVDNVTIGNISNVTFSGNKAEQENGGAMRISGSTVENITNTTFTDAVCNRGGNNNFFFFHHIT